jgi:hypothetical protein
MEWKKWIGAAVVVVVVLFLIKQFAPASIQQQLGLVS